MIGGVCIVVSMDVFALVLLMLRVIHWPLVCVVRYSGQPYSDNGSHYLVHWGVKVGLPAWISRFYLDLMFAAVAAKTGSWLYLWKSMKDPSIPAIVCDRRLWVVHKMHNRAIIARMVPDVFFSGSEVRPIDLLYIHFHTRLLCLICINRPTPPSRGWRPSLFSLSCSELWTLLNRR